MNKVLTVVIDDREQDRIPLAQEYYEKLGYDVTVERLEYGDYLFNDNVVFEYKNSEDYVNSLIDGRLYRETVNQSNEYPYHFLLLHSDNYTMLRALHQHQVFYGFWFDWCCLFTNQP